MNKGHGLNSKERAPFSLFHAAVEREKEEEVKQHHIEMIAEGQINIFELNNKKEEEAKLNMTKQAIAKLKDEMTKNKTNAYVQVIGGFLISHVEENPSSAEKILTEGKTIIGSLGAMRKEAEKKKQGNCAVLTDQEGFAIVLQYFGINSKLASTNVQQQIPTPTKTDDEPQTADNTPKNKTRFEASLDDFL